MTKFEVGSDTSAATNSHAAPLKLSFVEFVTLTAALMALTALSIDIMLPALPDIGNALGAKSDNERQLIIVLYMAGFAAGQIIYGPLSDRIGRRPVLLAGLTIFILGTLGALLSESFNLLLASRVVQGLGAASPRVVAMAVVRDIYSGRQMARVMSLAMMVFITIPVLAPSLGQMLLHLGDWHWMFYALLVMGFAISVWAGLRLPETCRNNLDGEPALSLWQSFKAAALNPQTMAYGAAMGFMFGCLLAYIASSQQIFVEVYNLGDTFPIVFGAIAAAMAVASFANAQLVERLGMRLVSRTALAGFIIVSLLLVGMSALGVTHLFVFVACVAIAFFMFGFIAPNFNALAMEPQGHNAGMASSIIGALSTSIGALAGGLIGHAFNGTVVPLALGFAACSLISLFIVTAVD